MLLHCCLLVWVVTCHSQNIVYVSQHFCYINLAAFAHRNANLFRLFAVCCLILFYFLLLNLIYLTCSYKTPFSTSALICNRSVMMPGRPICTAICNNLYFIKQCTLQLSQLVQVGWVQWFLKHIQKSTKSTMNTVQVKIVSSIEIVSNF